ncbi:hypothetical protein SH1V18_47520 [Vallitalea longa]|uniref:N-acetyltransferase domain-containing protein n=1 Tax=Vallitalea longa TaxID=2936439 RepID=A0A9W5YE38_9FIRM|nr:GNAT family N-acetyltransferase [Vallitalea longa]GKX32272.1 hypothetical protein SH1V18_47520 [Vallitalea longa]
MIVRKATTDDLSIIKKLYWLLDTDAIYYQPDHFMLSERPDDFILDKINNEKTDFLLGEIDDETIGFILIIEKETPNISCLKKERYAYIFDFVIAEEYRSKGYGALLMQFSKEWGRERNLDSLKLSVFPDNYRGIEFYKKQGLITTMHTMKCSL